MRTVSPELIKPNPDQPREIFDESKLKELSRSIKNHGVIEPIIVRERDGNFEIIAGERRWRASVLAGIEEVPVIVSDLDDNASLEMALIENMQREDLNVVELARGYKMLLDRFSYSQEELATKLGISRTNLTNTLRILKLSDKIQEKLLLGKISFGAARALLSVEDEARQLEIARMVEEKDLSVREVERMIRNQDSPKKKREKTIFIRDLEERLSQHTDSKVNITNHKQNGVDKGKIEIRYSSLEHLQSILNKIGLEEVNNEVL